MDQGPLTENGLGWWGVPETFVPAVLEFPLDFKLGMCEPKFWVRVSAFWAIGYRITWETDFHSGTSWNLFMKHSEEGFRRCRWGGDGSATEVFTQSLILEPV